MIQKVFDEREVIYYITIDPKAKAVILKSNTELLTDAFKESFIAEKKLISMDIYSSNRMIGEIVDPQYTEGPNIVIYYTDGVVRYKSDSLFDPHEEIISTIANSLSDKGIIITYLGLNYSEKEKNIYHTLDQSRQNLLP